MAAVAAIGLVISVAQTLLRTLQTKEQLKELCLMFGYKQELERLQQTVEMIKAILLDVDCKQQDLSKEGQILVERLKDAVYDADDLLDEFITVSDQLNRVPGGKLSRKVRRFFSNKNQLLFGYSMSDKIKKLRKKLDEIADDCKKFGFSAVYVHVKRTRKETVSVVNERSIIGREKDKEAIVSMLLSDTKDDVSCVSIVGMGGLGKTTLAQLVFDDDRIKMAFGKNDMYWVCVSEDFGKNEILAKMLPSKNYELNLEEINRQVQEKIKGKRYLLVLDDVWCEERILWVDLIDFLGVGGRGSRILITSRSSEVAKVAVIREEFTHHLGCLSEDHSWDLFKKIAFRTGKEEEDDELVDIAKEITKKCRNIPLSIKVIGSLLYGQERNKWVSFKNTDFTKMRQDSEKSIMPILMFSYYYLTPELKACFSFCSLFPKDYVINKEKLIRLWMAQGYLIPSNKRQSMEDVGEEYFSILMQRCFFQDIIQDKFDRVESCKMHDLIHDLAERVAGKEALVLPCNTDPVKKKIRHLSMATFEYFNNWCGPSYCSNNKLRTMLQVKCRWDSREYEMPIITKYRCLRVLDLRALGIENLPDTISELIHLRYLDLSYNRALKNLPKSITKLHNLKTLILRKCDNLEELPKDTSKLVNLSYLDLSCIFALKSLPKSITNLHNLKTLILRKCGNLEELPEDISKLVNLRILDIIGCDKLSYMPIGMSKLTCLNTLSLFVVGADDSKHVKKADLADLKPLLNHLRDELRIKFAVGGYAHYQFKDGHVKDLRITFYDEEDVRSQDEEYIIFGNEEEISYDDEKDLRSHDKGKKIFGDEEEITYDYEEDLGDQGRHVQEMLLEHLPCNNQYLSYFRICYYQGKKWPSWASPMADCFPRLVRITLDHNGGLKDLTSLSQLCHLKVVEIEDMENLECIENDYSPSMPFFPSLEELTLERMPKLKGWWRDIEWRESEAGVGGCLVDCNAVDQHVILPSFPHLRELKIRSCPNMMYLPPCAHSQRLDIREVNDGLRICMTGGIIPSTSATSSSNLNPTKDRESLSNDSKENRLFCVDYVVIDNGVVFNTLFREFVPGVAFAEIINLRVMESLMSLREGFEHLTNLRHLTLHNCYELELEDEEEWMPWKSLNSLNTLSLEWLPKLVKVPKGLHYLPCLQYLYIKGCNNLVTLGESIGLLTSLKCLRISECPNLIALPESLKLLTSLTEFEVVNCELLEDRCREPDGEDWPKVSHIRRFAILSVDWGWGDDDSEYESSTE